jgi:stress response protein YsnF
MTLSSDPGETIALHAEDVSVERRKVERDVRVQIQTVTHDHLIAESLAHESVEIERVPVGRPVDTVPPIREEGDTTVLSLVEEVLVVERRLILKEEIHLRRVRTTEQHREKVTLRQQQAIIERTEPGADLAPIPPALKETE